MIVQSWQEATPAIWDQLGAWVGVEVPSLLVPPLNIAAFLVLTAIGVRVREHRSQERAMRSIPSYHLIGAIAVLSSIGYVVVAGLSQSSGAGGAPADAPLIIFLAAAAASFSPVVAGGGNLVKRLWSMLAGVGILLALNEFTKIALEITAPRVTS